MNLHCSPHARRIRYAVLITVVFSVLSLPAGSFARESADVMALYEQYRAEELSDVPEVHVGELLERLQSGNKRILLLDVREPSEQAVSRIPGAIPRSEFERDPNQYRDYTLIPYCTIGYRSGFYTRQLRTQGYNALNLAGGVLAWAHHAQTFQAEEGDTRKVHVYGARWNLLPEGYEAIEPDWWESLKLRIRGN